MASNINVNIGDDSLADIYIEPDDLLTVVIRYGKRGD
jgi:hypothetical protein